MSEAFSLIVSPSKELRRRGKWSKLVVRKAARKHVKDRLIWSINYFFSVGKKPQT
jgi:hypothetical protein